VKHARLMTCAAAVAAAAWMAMAQVSARQAAPGAPANLTYLVNNSGVQLQWTHATGPFTHYQIEAAAGPGQAPFFLFPTSQFANPNDPNSKLPERLNGFSAGGVGSGTYYVKIRGFNGGVAGPASGEVAVPIAPGCQVPGVPTNFTVITRGTLGLLMWNPGTGGLPSTYIVQASYTPNDPAPPIQIPLTTPYFTLDIPAGTYYVKLAAANGCGVSARSTEVTIVAPSTTADRVPDPPAGQRLPQPYVRDLVAQYAAEARNLGYLNPQVACPTRPGYAVDYVEARKTQRNAYIDYVLSRLRTIDRRFGFNAKPTRAYIPAIIAGDEIAYHYGSDAPEGSPNVYIVDVLGGHCTGILGDADRHSPDYRVFYDEFGRWTSAGAFVP
jgi:hypothetical protein